jgi:hypothetical protein
MQNTRGLRLLLSLMYRPLRALLSVMVQFPRSTWPTSKAQAPTPLKVHSIVEDALHRFSSQRRKRSRKNKRRSHGRCLNCYRQLSTNHSICC